VSIGKKILIIVTAMILTAVVATLFLSAIIFRDSFLNLEKQNLNSNIRRTENALTVTTNQLVANTQDWAAWDDTYYFAKIGDPAYGNQDFVDNAFLDQIFEDKNLNVVVVVDSSGNIVYGKSYDLSSHTDIPLPQEIYTYISSGKLPKFNADSSGAAGIILLQGTPLLISAQPILTSMFQGPSTGTLIFGVFMDSSFINQLSQSTQTTIDIWQENNGQIPSDFQKAKNMIPASGTNFTMPLNNQYAAGYTLIDDIYGNPAVILKTTTSRDFYNQGRLTVVFLFVVLGLASILFGLVFIFVMRRTILKRFDALATGVSMVGSTGDVSKTISLPSPLIGKDELSDLADNINNMLGKIGDGESKLQAQRDLFERLLLYIPALILVVDSNLNITLVNKAFCNLYNVREVDAIGKSLSIFFPPEEIAEARGKMLNIEGAVSSYEHRLKIGKKDRILDTTYITVSPNEYLLIGRDITQEREEQEKLYLNDRLASVGEMAAGIAHELNNPLTGIVMLSQLLMQTDFAPEVKKDLSDINGEATRATDVVRNLLAFARKQPPAKRLTQINKIVGDVLRLRHYEETVNNITVITNLDPDLPEIMVDNIQIQQVFLNLILNAEYSMIHAHKKGQLRVDTFTADGKVVISFTDDGEGIKEEDMRKIFQPFFTTKEVGVGTGLGLSLCFGIVKRHGGVISIESKYGAGATFTVELPIETPNADGDNSDSK
jgi:PAS domain S-box-containing protein